MLINLDYLSRNLMNYPDKTNFTVSLLLVLSIYTKQGAPCSKNSAVQCFCVIYHEFHETCHSITFYIIKKTPNDAVTTLHRVNSHQRWKQMWNWICFHLWCKLTSTINVTEWQVSWNSWTSRGKFSYPQFNIAVFITWIRSSYWSH